MGEWTIVCDSNALVDFRFVPVRTVETSVLEIHHHHPRHGPQANDHHQNIPKSSALASMAQSISFKIAGRNKHSPARDKRSSTGFHPLHSKLAARASTALAHFRLPPLASLLSKPSARTVTATATATAPTRMSTSGPVPALMKLPTHALTSAAAPAPIMEAAGSTSPLLNLPAELRNNIYSLVQAAGYVDIRGVTRFIPSIAYVNWQVHLEWIGFWHESSHFMLHMNGFSSNEAARAYWAAWADSLQPPDAARVRHLVFYAHKFVLKLTVREHGVYTNYIWRTTDEWDKATTESELGWELGMLHGMADKNEMLKKMGEAVTRVWR